MAQGVAWMAREIGVEAAVVVPDHAPRAKLDAIARLGGRAIPVPFETWWEAMENGAFPGLDGHFVHPVRDPAVMAGNGVIGLELVEQLEGIDAVLVPWGGGGLTTGIASALAARSPHTAVYACEPATGAPVTAALAAGHPVTVDYRPSFVDGAGSKGLLPDMWELARPLLTGAVAVPIAEAAEAVRLLAERLHVIAEGAGALGLAAALSGAAGRGRVVCIVSGGNIDATRLATILGGGVPE
jgi:threonine dehydratase